MTSTTSTETAFDPTITAADEGAEIRESIPAPNEGYSASDSYGEGFDQLQDRAHQMDQRVRTFVGRHPIPSIAIAAAAGFLIGRIASRIL
jgi:ElaB/YqjD/DUF883 family membrane-anchored ribosome-binding protein